MSVWIEQAASILFSFESKLAGFLRKKEALKKVSSPLELTKSRTKAVWLRLVSSGTFKCSA